MSAEKSSKSDYTSIRRKMLTGEAFVFEDYETILKLGLQFSSKLIEKNEDNIIGLGYQDRELKEFLAVVVFFRMIRLVMETKVKKISNTDSYTLFNDFKTYISMKFKEDISSVDDDYLISILKESERLESFITNPENEAKMHLIRNFAAQLVPDNPRGTTGGVVHLLD